VQRVKFCKTAIFAGTLGFLGVAPVGADDTFMVFEDTDRPSLNFYGSAGLIDMPSADMLPDGTFAIGFSNFGGNSRTTLTFQATPRLSASFRYVGIRNWNSDGFDTYRDRSFDLRYLISPETSRFPAITVGLQDFAGTGIYAGEYIVATKTFSGGRIPGKVKLTGGLGWGRLGSAGAIGAPLGGNRNAFQPGDDGGQLSAGSWFRGDAAPFGGVEWQINDRFGIKAEVSSDAYTAEAVDRSVFTRKSRFNFGAEYQYSDRLRLGAYYLYGSEFGFTAQLQLNPKRPITPNRVIPAEPIAQRPSRAASPEAYQTDWATSEAASGVLRDVLAPILTLWGDLRGRGACSARDGQGAAALGGNLPRGAGRG